VVHQRGIDILGKESRGKQEDGDHNPAHEDLRWALISYLAIMENTLIWTENRRASPN
jgi:hypothetical protein